ncbi:MAG: hypothetical protein ACPL28_10035 [bacterium]
MSRGDLRRRDLKFRFGVNFLLPSGLALSYNQKTLYVSDTRHKRVLAFIVRDEPLQFPG